MARKYFLAHFSGGNILILQLGTQLTDGQLLIYFWTKNLAGNDLLYSYTRSAEIKQMPKMSIVKGLGYICIREKK